MALICDEGEGAVVAFSRRALLGRRLAPSDGLMALFGYPIVQESDAERAVRAALAILRSLAELNRKNEQAAIDLGPVVVDATGEIFGNLAAHQTCLSG